MGVLYIPIGLDQNLVNELDVELALRRIGCDILSDFIFAPHYSAVFRFASKELIATLIKKLRSGTYFPMLPITIEVVKKTGTTRPGSILNPIDRLLYQSLIDKIAPIADKNIDRSRVYSNIISMEDTGSMFEPQSKSYKELKRKLQVLCENKKYNHVLFIDIACYFDRIYQHVLINLLRSTTIKAEYTNLLEKVLSEFTQKDSHGIIQGLFPSDFLGNYYLCSFDSFLKTKGIEFIRYVDDYWMFFHSEKDAKKFLVKICNYVRKEGLYLNESKTMIKSTEDTNYEENKIDTLFNAAREEFKKQRIYVSEYSFEPFQIDSITEELDFDAIKELYNNREDQPRLLERIDKFCLPLLARYNSDLAVEDAIEGIEKRPHLVHIYAQYLGTIARSKEVIFDFIEKLLIEDKFLYDWQKMWVLGLLFHANKISNELVNKAYFILEDFDEDITLRAICAIIVSKFGDGASRRLVRNHYSIEPSMYVKEAILYSTKFFPSNDDKNTCIKTWRNHSDISELIAIAISNEGKLEKFNGDGLDKPTEHISAQPI